VQPEDQDRRGKSDDEEIGKRRNKRTTVPAAEMWQGRKIGRVVNKTEWRRVDDSRMEQHVD